MRIFALIATFMLAAPVLAPTAHAQDAQTTREKERAARIAAEAAREAAEKRVEADMVQMNDITEALAKNLGQLHYLRTLCFGTDDQMWREQTAAMMDIEAKNDDARRQALIRAFNAGYYQEKERHNGCTQALQIDVAALAENARNLATMLGDPFREN